MVEPMTALWGLSILVTTITSAVQGPIKKEQLQIEIDRVTQNIQNYKEKYSNLLSSEQATYDTFISTMTGYLTDITNDQKRLNLLKRDFATHYRSIQLAGLITVIIIFGIFLMKIFRYNK